MADLSHWDWAEQFSGYDAAALILGLEPRDSDGEQWRVRVVTDRMELDYKRAFEKSFNESFGDPFDKPVARQNEDAIGLKSVRLQELEFRYWQFSEETPFTDWLADKRQTKFEWQEFSREEIVRWLLVVGMKSTYNFDKKNQSATDGNSNSGKELDIDPTELPEELDAANVAYRGVLNGFDVRPGTFKSKLIAYLKLHYPHFNDETIERIATVANPHKARGRRKREVD